MFIVRKSFLILRNNIKHPPNSNPHSVSHVHFALDIIKSSLYYSCPSGYSSQHILVSRPFYGYIFQHPPPPPHTSFPTGASGIKKEEKERKSRSRLKDGERDGVACVNIGEEE